MLKMFEKLINEHGSSVILKERLQLFSDKYMILEDKLESSSQKNEALAAENQSLKTQLDQAKQEIKRLEEIAEISAENNGPEELDEVKKQILKTLFAAQDYLTIPDLVRQLGQQDGIIQYHIDSLKDEKLITHGPIFINSPATYDLTKLGRQYVVETLGV